MTDKPDLKVVAINEKINVVQAEELLRLREALVDIVELTQDGTNVISYAMAVLVKPKDGGYTRLVRYCDDPDSIHVTVGLAEFLKHYILTQTFDEEADLTT